MNELNEFREEFERIREYSKEATDTIKEAAAALSELFEYVKEVFEDFLEALSEKSIYIDYGESEFSHNCVIYIADREKKREPRGKVNKITRWASRRAHPR